MRPFRSAEARAAERAYVAQLALPYSYRKGRGPEEEVVRQYLHCLDMRVTFMRLYRRNMAVPRMLDFS